ncbi:ABC-2 transporter permease [Clostridium botulinum]|uniref:ABC-2 transporter permease n=1 Tax=Clostridium botulinum TaxID=1491 RepID=UPI0004D72588|nr:ABC-2 transporter permease [Clostridium botulinum]KEI02920.1 membrane protein [Clostridium botulinum D str. 16868]
MKNYFNKALIYREWRNIRALALLFFLEVMFVTIVPFIHDIRTAIDAINNKNIYGDHWESLCNMKDYFQGSNQTGLISVSISVIFIATIVIGGDLIGRKYEELNSLPFSRDQIIVSKWIIAMLVIVVPLIVGTSLVHILYHINENFIGKSVTNKMILSWSSINILIPVFVLTFIMLIQTLSGKHLIGGIVGGIFLVFPLAFGSLVFMATDIFRKNPDFINFIREHLDGIFSNLYNFARIITPAAYGFDLRLEKPEGYDVYTFDSFSGFFSPRLRIIFLIVFTILAFILMVYVFKRVPIERCGYIVIFKPLEIIFKIGVSVCFGLLGASIVSPMIESHYDLWQLENQNSTNFVHVVNKTCTLTLLIGLLCGCIVYVITNKIIEANKR